MRGIWIWRVDVLIHLKPQDKNAANKYLDGKYHLRY
jgi:hypothetical protein